MTDNQIPAPLSAEEWAAYNRECSSGRPIKACDICFGQLNDHERAVVLLHGQPFGFTHEDVANLRRLAERLQHGHGDAYTFAELNPWILPLTARIAALLPPE